jgi:DNA-binding CsgD family transcriptional regulator
LTSLFPDASRADFFLQNIVASGQPDEIEISFADGQLHPRIFRLNARVVDDGDGPPRIDGLLEDITRRKQTEISAKQGAIAEAQIAMLSPREIEVMHEVVAGNANKVIARHLDISEKTVEKHRSSLMRKLTVQSVAELVRMAMLAENAAK